MDENTNWTSIDLYYKGFHIKKSVPKDVDAEILRKNIDELIEAGFQPSWNVQTSEEHLDPVMKATNGQGKKYVCKTCGADAEYREGVSKSTGKPWKAIFCKETKEHVEWGAQK